jgi:DNA-binding transcriptional regulator YiaG
MFKTKSFKQALHDAGLSVKQFADLSDTPLQTVYHWTQGTRRTPGIAFTVLVQYLEIKNLSQRQAFCNQSHKA